MITAHKTLDICVGNQHISVEQTFNIPNTNNTTCMAAWRYYVEIKFARVPATCHSRILCLPICYPKM